MNPIATTSLVLGAVLILIAVVALVFLLIWNRTVPAVFGLKPITFWQSVGILVLASILTGSYRVITTDIANSLKLLGIVGALVQ
jgi:hypothetical protein